MAEIDIGVEGDFEHQREPRQFYESTILIEASDQAIPVSFGVIPARSIDPDRAREVGHPAGLLNIIGGDPATAIRLTNMTALTTAVGLMIDPAFAGQPGEPHPWSQFAPEVAEDPEGTFREPPWWRHRQGRAAAQVPCPRLLSTSCSVRPSHSRTVLFLPSQLHRSSVGQTGGALVLAVVTGLTTPWVLSAVPAGMILMRATDGAGDAVYDIVKVLRWLAPEFAKPKGKRRKPK